MTEAAGPGEIARFYDELATDYDRMTAFENRLVAERPFIRLLVERHGIKHALDAGAGTGLHSVLLAEMGVRVTSVDLSAPMLRSLARRAEDDQLPVTVIQSTLAELPRSLDRSFDAVFCMGNTLAHILTPTELRQALSAFGRVLRPGGILFLQVLNYDRIIAQGASEQNIRHAEGATYRRFYEFQEGGRLTFHVEKRDERGGQFATSRISLELMPWVSADLARHLSEASFREVELFGSMRLDRFESPRSKDLVVRARTSS